MTDAEKNPRRYVLLKEMRAREKKEWDRVKRKRDDDDDDGREKGREKGMDEGEKKPSVRSRGPPRCSYPIYLVRDLHSLRALVY